MFVVNWRGRLWVDDGDNDSGGSGADRLLVDKVIYNDKVVSGMYFGEVKSSKMYLVESSKRELLLVCRSSYAKYSAGYDYHATAGFRVYKLLMKERKWEEIGNLNENEALFIGGNQGVCILLDRFVHNNIEPNCIYFTKDFSCSYAKLYDSGFYSLGTRRLVVTEVAAKDEFASYGAFLHGWDR